MCDHHRTNGSLENGLDKACLNMVLLFSFEWRKCWTAKDLPKPGRQMWEDFGLFLFPCLNTDIVRLNLNLRKPD